MSHDRTEGTQHETTATRPRRRRRWLWGGLAVVVLLLVLAYAAPWIVARTALRDRILPLALPDYPAAMEAEAASLDWRSPVVLRQVTFADMDGEAMLVVDRLETEQSLFDLVFGTDDVRLAVDGFRLHVEATETGTNVEAVIAAFPEPVPEEVGPSVTVQLAGGTIEVVDLDTAARGTIEELTGEVSIPAAPEEPVDVDLAGRANYEWERLQPLVTRLVGEDVHVTGRVREPITVSGPVGTGTDEVIPPGLTVETTLAWDGATAYRLPVEPGNLTVRLRGDRISFEPFAIGVAGGRLEADPLLRLTPGGTIFESTEDVVLTGVELTPELTSHWVRYVAPALADSAQIEGKFSARIESLHVPLEEYENTRLRGVVGVEVGEARPGELAEALLIVAQRLYQLVELPGGEVITEETFTLQLPKQEIVFRTENQRVYHDRLRMTIAGIDMETTGWVGFDETVDLTAAVPIKPAWVRDNDYLDGLAGEHVTVRITGTLTEPVVSQDDLLALATKLGRKVIEDQIGDAIERGIRDLIGF